MDQSLETARAQLRASFRGVTDRSSTSRMFDYDSWWGDPALLRALGPLLAEPFLAERPSVVIGPTASGVLLGPLVALALGVGFVAVSKDPGSSVDSDPWRVQTSPPDYQDRHLRLGFRRRLITSTDRVLAVDDLIDTGGQLLTLQKLVRDCDATWVGASVLIDNLSTAHLRRSLNLRAVFHGREL